MGIKIEPHMHEWNQEVGINDKWRIDECALCNAIRVFEYVKITPTCTTIRERDTLIPIGLDRHQQCNNDSVSKFNNTCLCSRKPDHYVFGGMGDEFESWDASYCRECHTLIVQEAQGILGMGSRQVSNDCVKFYPINKVNKEC